MGGRARGGADLRRALQRVGAGGNRTRRRRRPASRATTGSRSPGASSMASRRPPIPDGYGSSWVARHLGAGVRGRARVAVGARVGASGPTVRGRRRERRLDRDRSHRAASPERRDRRRSAQPGADDGGTNRAGRDGRRGAERMRLCRRRPGRPRCRRGWPLSLARSNCQPANPALWTTVGEHRSALT